MGPDYSKRDYLLPKGCKDLIDVLNLQELGILPVSWPETRPKLGTVPVPWPPGQPTILLHQLPVELLIPEGTTVGEFAAMLGQKPFKIIADLMQLGAFAIGKQLVDFEAIRTVARKYGFEAKRPL
jgi:hypothetical protein